MIYENIKRNEQNIWEITNEVRVSFINGPRVDVFGKENTKYKIRFIDSQDNSVKYESTIGTNCWAKCNIQYYTNWLIEVYENDELFYTHKFNLENKRVYIALDSRALGDTLAWMGVLD